MAYTTVISLTLGTSKAGLADLRAQLTDAAGIDTGLVIDTGFVEIGNGNYHWAGSIPDGHQGGIWFYSEAAPAEVLAFASINPQIEENGDIKVSSIINDALVQSYAADGAQGTLPQILYGIQQVLQQFAISGNFTIVYELDGVTEAFRLTHDSETAATLAKRNNV